MLKMLNEEIDPSWVNYVRRQRKLPWIPRTEKESNLGFFTGGVKGEKVHRGWDRARDPREGNRKGGAISWGRRRWKD